MEGGYGWVWVNTEEKGHEHPFIELDDGKIYRKPLYLMVKTMVSYDPSIPPMLA